MLHNYIKNYGFSYERYTFRYVTLKMVVIKMGKTLHNITKTAKFSYERYTFRYVTLRNVMVRYVTLGCIYIHPVT